MCSLRKPAKAQNQKWNKAKRQIRTIGMAVIAIYLEHGLYAPYSNRELSTRNRMVRTVDRLLQLEQVANRSGQIDMPLYHLQFIETIRRLTSRENKKTNKIF